MVINDQNRGTTRRDLLKLLGLGTAALGSAVTLEALLPRVAFGREGEYDVSYLWTPDKEAALEYMDAVGGFLGPNLRRGLRIAKGNSGNFGIVYDRNGDLESTIRVASSHDGTLRDCDLDGATHIQYTGYKILYNVSFGVGPNLKVQKKNFRTIAGLLGEGIASDLVIERTLDDNFALVYRRFGDKESTVEAAARLANLLSDTEIETDIRNENNVVVYTNQELLSEDEEDDRARNPVAPTPTPTPAPAPSPKPKTPPAPTPEPKTSPRQTEVYTLNSVADAEIKDRRNRGLISSATITAWSGYDLTTGEKFLSIREDEPMQCASMVKPLVGLAILHRAANDPNFHYGPNTTEQMERAIAYTAGSGPPANIATDWLIGQLGGPSAVQRILEDNYSRIFQNTSIVEKIGSSGQTYRNKASAHDYSRFLHALYHNELPNSAELRRLMAGSGKRIFSAKRTASIPRDQGIVCYNKTGTTGLLVGDMGIMVPREEDGTKHPYIIVGIIQRPSKVGSFSTWTNNSGYAIGAVSTLVYKHLDAIHNFKG